MCPLLHQTQQVSGTLKQNAVPTHAPDSASVRDGEAKCCAHTRTRLSRTVQSRYAPCLSQYYLRNQYVGHTVLSAMGHTVLFVMAHNVLSPWVIQYYLCNQYVGHTVLCHGSYCTICVTNLSWVILYYLSWVIQYYLSWVIL